MVQLLLLNQQDKTGTILVAVAGGLSTLAVSALLLHMASVAILSPLKRLTSAQKLPRERVFLTTHLGYYLACLLISGLFGGVASFLEITWAQSGAILQDGRCNTQGIFLQLGDIGTATFSFVIAFHTMNNLVLQKKLPTFAVLGVILLGWAFTMSLAIIGPATTTNFYDIEGLWCWISISHPGFQIFMNIIPVLLVAVLLVFMYGATYIKLRLDASDDDYAISLTGSTVNMSGDDYRRFLRPIAKKLFFYPIVYTTLVLPMAIIRLALLLDAPVPSSAIIFAAICDASMGFANTVVYVTTRNVGPSITWEGIRSVGANLILRSPGPEHKSILRNQASISERLNEKVGSVYSIGEPKLVQTTNSAEVRVGFANSIQKPVMVKYVEEAPPSFRALPATLAPSVLSPSEFSPTTVEGEDIEANTTTPKSVATDSVSRWRQRQQAYGPARTTASPRPQLPTSPQSAAMRHLRGTRSLTSLNSFERIPTPLIRRPTPGPAPSEDGSAIIESYFEVPDALRPRVPLGARSNQTNEWSFTSQASLISHIRALSDPSAGPSIARTASAASNPIVPPGMGGANLPFALYPGGVDSASRSPLGLQGIPRRMTPEMAEATFTPSTAGWKTPKSSNTRI